MMLKVFRRIGIVLGVLLVLAGVACFMTSAYIKDQVEQGVHKVNRAQKQVDQTNSLFSMVPEAGNTVGKGITGRAQKKIDAGELEIARYEILAENLHTAGIVIVVLGGVLILISAATIIIEQKSSRKRK